MMARINIRQPAEAQGLDISKLSRKSNISYKTVWELWNNPDRDVSLRTLEKLAGALGVPVQQLIEDDISNAPSVVVLSSDIDQEEIDQGTAEQVAKLRDVGEVDKAHELAKTIETPSIRQEVDPDN